MGGAEAFRANGEAPGVEGLDKLYPGVTRHTSARIPAVSRVAGCSGWTQHSCAWGGRSSRCACMQCLSSRQLVPT